jgi:hypothetical protein
MLLMGGLIGAVDALKLITKGPGPPNRGVSGEGASKSSMLRCQISRVNGEFIGAAINAFPRTVRVRQGYWLSTSNETVIGVSTRRQRC